MFPLVLFYRRPDSSSIVSIAKEYVADIPCFTIDVGEDQESGATQDLPFAKMAAKHLGLKLHRFP